MNTAEIKSMQERIGVTPDGFWGPKSIAACQKHLRSLMPSPNPWPASDQASLRKFYGEPGDEDNLVTIEFPLVMKYGGKEVRKTRCHKRLADSLIRVFNDIHKRYQNSNLIMSAATDYGGIFNDRPKRGGTTPSLHAYGAAIDLDADNNGFKDNWPLRSTMPLEIMECFAREGWKAAGAFWGYDAMHFEATK